MLLYILLYTKDGVTMGVLKLLGLLSLLKLLVGVLWPEYRNRTPQFCTWLNAEADPRSFVIGSVKRGYWTVKGAFECARNEKIIKVACWKFNDEWKKKSHRCVNAIFHL